MTRRLYFDDPYTLEFEAEIVERRDTERGPAVLLRETYFYPESGGQPYDLGTLDGIPVTAVLEEGEEVLHLLERFPEASRVRCRIDGARRRDHMQQHSGQHVLSAAFVREAGASTTSFHLGGAVSTIDLDKPSLTEEEMRLAERAANETVRRALAIESRFVDAETAKELELRKPPPEAERLRIVEVKGFDRQACCGTHPRSSAEIGPIVLRGVEKIKEGTRVEFLCGDRVFRDYRETVGRVRALASVLSSAEADLVATAEKLVAERKTLGKELTRAKGELLLARIEDWMSEAEPLGDRHLLVKRLEDVEPAELRTVAVELTSRPGRLVLLGSVASGRAHLVFAASEDAQADMGRLLRECVALVDGKGGGSARVAQGGGARTAGLDEALERAATRLR